MLVLGLTLVVLSISIAQALSTSSCERAANSSKDSRVWWDPKTKRCTPDLCDGVKLADIPDVSGYLPNALACQMELYDADRIRGCFEGKHVVLLGDSTMSETVHDLVLLVSGLANWPDQVNTYVYNATRQGRAYSEIWIPYKGLKPPHGLKIEFFGNHRNMTVSAPTLGLTITHRFTGHVDLKENMMGLDTFFHRDFQREFRCLTDPQPGQGCQKRRPDMLVVNSGLHDIKTAIPKFAMNMRALAQRLKTISQKGTTVAWRGNNLLPHTHGMDVISRHYIESEGLKFVDTRGIMEYFKADIATGCCTDLTKTGGAHIGAIAKFHNESSRLTVSSMVTQGILQALCNKPKRSAPVSNAL
ncbi:g13084 [Coccomyxa viridis]|uniref:G13084 protein n=1 Tax=Coccomyxa viridis TaxID=1274662 RepID=A0ABP1GBX9_9CHLO